MKKVNKFSPNITYVCGTDAGDVHIQNNPRVHNLRYCPACGASLFGMPGGRDASCTNCGYKDPCCSD